MTQVLFLDQCSQAIVLRLGLAVGIRCQLLSQRVIALHLVLVHQVIQEQDLIVELGRGIFLNQVIFSSFYGLWAL